MRPKTLRRLVGAHKVSAWACGPLSAASRNTRALCRLVASHSASSLLTRSFHSRRPSYKIEAHGDSDLARDRSSLRNLRARDGLSERRITTSIADPPQSGIGRSSIQGGTRWRLTRRFAKTSRNERGRKMTLCAKYLRRNLIKPFPILFIPAREQVPAPRDKKRGGIKKKRGDMCVKSEGKRIMLKIIQATE